MTSITLKTVGAGLVAAAIATTALTVPTTPAAAYTCASYTFVPKTQDQRDKMKLGVQLLGILNSANAAVHQNGKGNSAGIAQGGGNNGAFIYQNGNGHTGTVQQSGGNNGHVLLQYGNGATSHVQQTGGQYSASVQVGC